MLVILFEVPSNLILRRTGARVWIARMAAREEGQKQVTRSRRERATEERDAEKQPAERKEPQERSGHQQRGR